MHPIQRTFIILDIETLNNLTLKEIITYNLNEDCGLRADELDNFFDWVINTTLQNLYGVRVVGLYQHDIYKCLYPYVRKQFEQWFLANLSVYEMASLRGCEIKTLINGRDLFITKKVFRHSSVF